MTDMDHRAEVREFLSTRRARLQPSDIGLPAVGNRRRVPGLRREEVAMLAGISADYYTRLERGNLSGVSDGVLEALATALRLDDAERSHLDDLARFANTASTRRIREEGIPQGALRPGIARIVDALSGVAGFVMNDKHDLLAINSLGRALFPPVFAGEPQEPVNLARFMFLDPAAHELFRDWEEAAGMLVGNLRTAAGRNPYDTELHQLVGELSARSGEFSRLWAAHDVRIHRTGVKVFNHPVVGELTLAYEVLAIAADHGLALTVYMARPGSVEEESMALLADRGEAAR